MPNAHDLVKAVATELGLAQQINQLVRDGDLGSCLHDLDGIRVVGQAHAQLVVGERRVACCRSCVDVAIARGNVPVIVVEGGAVGQQLHRLDLGQLGSVFGQAELDEDVITAGDDTGPPRDDVGNPGRVRLEQLDE